MVLREIQILEAGLPVGRKHSSTRPSTIPTTASFYTATHKPPQARDKTKRDPTCAFCKGTHKTSSCTSITCPKERLAIVKSAGLCFNCLARHKVSQCTSKFNCRECHKKHHTTLCRAFATTTRPPQQNQPQLDTVSSANSAVPPTNTLTSANSTATSTISDLQPTTKQTLTTMTPPPLSALHSSICLLKTAIADVSGDSTTVEGHILFDEGAQRSFITQELANILQLTPVRHELITVSSFGAQISTPTRFAVTSISIHTLNGGKIPISVLIVPKLTAPIRNSIRTNLDQFPYLQELTLAHPITSDENFHVSVLIGADYFWQFIQDQVVRGNGPTAVQSRLGYLLSGPLLLPQSTDTAGLNVSVLSCTTEDATQRSFWNVESTGTTRIMKNSDTEFLHKYMATKIAVQPDGAYSLKFPWKDSHPPLPSNYTVCYRRTRSMVHRLAKTPRLLKMYDSIIKEQLTRGFIERVDDNYRRGSVHYIPHHPVRKESSTTPIRIVFDCSCKSSADSPSLNDCLHPGPPSVNDLCSILVRFRQHNIAFSADIEKAFLHVHLDKEDRDYTRFLWLSDPCDVNSPLIAFRFQVVLFGATCSPFMLHAALTYHLTYHGSTVSQDLLHNLYVDNVVSGTQTETESLDYFLQSRTILNTANFNLRSWASNNAQLRNAAKQHQAADTNNPVKVLGLWWDTHSDLIYSSHKPIASATATATTKRDILRWASAIFDPLGLISPVTISAKLFLQTLWQQHINWDTNLNEELLKTCNQISRDIVQATTLPFPRQCGKDISLTSLPEPTLHIFADASLRAYGAAVYLQQGTSCVLIMSKSRAAPLKQLSLPRLELMAAVIAARLYLFVKTSLSISSDHVLWSDSQIVLSWISSEKRLKPFVSNQVGEIRSISTSWRYCPSADNPADLLTRGIRYDHLHNSTQWNHGPSWLSSPSQWPTWHRLEVLYVQGATVELETVKHNTVTVTTTDLPGVQDIIEITTFSSLNKLIAVTAYLRRFIYNCRQTSTSRLAGPLTTSELARANLDWIRQVQSSTFHDEITALQRTSRRLPLVRQLRLFLDNDNLLRCGGRIHNAPLSELAKFPYLLPSHHYFTELVIRNAHTTTLHSGVNATLAIVRQTYWIPSARQRIKTVLRKCVICRKTTGKPYAMPEPPPLVKSRVSQTAPFQVTGVDFTGALFVRTSIGERKVYICLFTCAVSRALHLEIVTDLTVESFLYAFRRFAGRRSVPQLLLSDNGSTFIAAAEELKALFQSVEPAETLARRGTEWRFIPKRAPWFGGFWERLIGLTKTSLKKTLGRTHATLESLQTIVVEIEAILNDRPLTYQSSDASDPEPITPSHLLHGRRIVALPYSLTDGEIQDPPFGNTSEIRSRAKKQAHIIEHFQNRWRNEYLTALREAHRVSGSDIQQVKTGDVVLIHEDTPRINWRMAVIESVNKGGDGIIRSANIRTTTGKTNRPITRLYPLELTVEEIKADVQDDHHLGRSTIDTPVNRPTRDTAKRGYLQMKEWINLLSAPLEDVLKTQ